MYKEIFTKGIKIKIIGDSIAAGGGSSASSWINEVIFKDGDQVFYKRTAPNSWWGLFEAYLRNHYINCSVDNKGCGGAFSYQINEHLDTLVSDDDDMVFILMGLNDRKRVDGMNELKNNCEAVIERLIAREKIVVILTPMPSVHRNEYYHNRIYHTDEVVRILCDIAGSKKVTLVDNHQYIMKYLEENQLSIDDIIFGEGCSNDGMHPSDYVQKLMFHNLIDILQI